MSMNNYILNLLNIEDKNIFILPNIEERFIKNKKYKIIEGFLSYIPEQYKFAFICGLFGEPKDVNYLANIEKGIDTSGVLTLDYGSFKAITIAAKDCKAPVMCSIQGDEACIAIHSSVNGLTKFSVEYNDGTSKEFVDDSEKHRLYYEFMDFIQTVDNNNYAHMEELLEASTVVSKVMYDARKKAGIVFDNDLNI